MEYESKNVKYLYICAFCMVLLGLYSYILSSGVVFNMWDIVDNVCFVLFGISKPMMTASVKDGCLFYCGVLLLFTFFVTFSTMCKVVLEMCRPLMEHFKTKNEDSEEQ